MTDRNELIEGLLGDEGPPTSRTEAMVWSNAFWKAADPALAKAAPGARFRID